MKHHPFTSSPTRSVAALGETQLIAGIRRWLGSVSPARPFGIGDDCAVLPVRAARQLITVDPVIYGRHFDDGVPPRAVGEKLLKRNLSDIAAMGGRPTYAVVALALAADLRTDWLEAFHRGLAACARRHGVKIVGGDVAGTAPGFFGAWLTLHGESAGRRVLTRTGAHRGDWILVTGPLGGSRPGHHYRFTPRLAEGAWLARQPDVVSMIDVSDGIAKDLAELTPAGTVPDVLPRAIPLSRAARKIAATSGRPAWWHAVTDGEDYELLFTVRRAADLPRLMTKWHRHFGRPLFLLGKFAKTASPGSIDWPSLHGFEHLR